MRPPSLLAYALLFVRGISGCCDGGGNAHADIVCTYEEAGETVVYDETRLTCGEFTEAGYQVRDSMLRDCEGDGGDEVVRTCLCEEYPSPRCTGCVRDD